MADFTAPAVASATDIRQEYDFQVKKISLVAYNGKEYNITPLRNVLDIYGNIFDSVMCGSIALYDAMDFPQLMPLVGEEKINIVFTRPDAGSDTLLPDINMSFRIYKITERQPIKEKVQSYILHFCSAEFITNFKTKIFQGYTSMLYSDIVSNIYNQYLKSSKPLNIEPTKWAQNFRVANCNPIEAFNMLAGRSVSASDNGSAYVFYEDAIGFNFVSVGKLFQQAPVATYIYATTNVLADTNTAYKSRTIEGDIVSVNNYVHIGGFDVLQKLRYGMYSSRLVTVDPIRRVIAQQDFDYASQFNQFKHIDKFPLHTDSLDAFGSPVSVVKCTTTNKDHDKLAWIASKQPGIKPKHVEDSLQFRISQMQQLHTSRIAVNLSGDPRRKVGEVITFKLPQNMSNVSKENPMQYDQYLQGNYLITNIRHRLTADKYSMQLEIVRDSFASEINHIDPLAAYSDVI